MARVLITGGTGLIGRRAVEAFAGSTDEIIAVGRGDIDLLAAGGWERLLDRHTPTAIVHLAWSASAVPGYRADAANERWADATIDAARRSMERGVRLIATGTALDDVDGDAYSRAKARTRRALDEAIEAGGVTWLRPYYVFDESRPSPAVLAAALSARDRGEPVALATPDARHDFVHAIDVGTAIRSIVESGVTGTIDIGSGRLTSVARLVEAFDVAWVRGAAGAPPPASEAVADVARLVALGWRPTATDDRLGG